MRKTFPLSASNRAPARQIEWVKHEIKKYMDREKRKTVPEGYSFWDFDCKIGPDEESLKEIYPNEIRKNIDSLVQDGVDSFFLEVLVKPCKHNPDKAPRRPASEGSQD